MDLGDRPCDLFDDPQCPSERDRSFVIKERQQTLTLKQLHNDEELSRLSLSIVMNHHSVGVSELRGG